MMLQHPYPDMPVSWICPTFTATEAEGSQAFTIAATGTLTLHVNETGAEDGTPVIGGTFIRCNSDGTETYGTAKTIDASGVCTFEVVPFGTGEAPVSVYVKLLTGNDSHNLHEDVVTASMDEESKTQYVRNAPVITQIFTFAYANCAGLHMNGFEGLQAG